MVQGEDLSLYRQKMTTCVHVHSTNFALVEESENGTPSEYYNVVNNPSVDNVVYAL
jgi:hypothetical protein